MWAEPFNSPIAQHTHPVQSPIFPALLSQSAPTPGDGAFHSSPYQRDSNAPHPEMLGEDLANNLKKASRSPSGYCETLKRLPVRFRVFRSQHVFTRAHEQPCRSCLSHTPVCSRTCLDCTPHSCWRCTWSPYHHAKNWRSSAHHHRQKPAPRTNDTAFSGDLTWNFMLKTFVAT